MPIPTRQWKHHAIGKSEVRCSGFWMKYTCGAHLCKKKKWHWALPLKKWVTMWMHHVRYTEVMCNKWECMRKERSSEDKESKEATFCNTEQRKQGMNWRWQSGACLKFSYQASLRRNLLCGVNGPYHSRLAGSHHRSSVLDLLSFLQ